MKIETKDYIWGSVCGVLLLALGFAWYENDTLSRESEARRVELESYQENEGKSYVVERISQQMEDIAYQQKDIAEKQREEAVFQMSVADSMRLRAEEEQRNAQEFARNMVEARNMAEEQRERAIQQQRRAEYARTVADTLSNVALGRVLASLSAVQYQAGNRDASALLAYASWSFTTEYRGNVYLPVIFNALILNSRSFQTQNVHRGGVSRIVSCPDSAGDYVSVSRYGEVKRWHGLPGEIRDQLLFSDSTCSFRDVYVDTNQTIYALSYEGKMCLFSPNTPVETLLLPETSGWMRVCPFDAERLLLASEHHLYFFDKAQKQIVRTIPLPQKLTALSEKEGQWFAYGEGGTLHRVGLDGALTPLEHWNSETVTACAWSPELQKLATGTENGNIYLVDVAGNSMRKLTGHRSKITQLLFHGHHLLSGSYDCTVNMWDVNATKQEPVPVRTLPSWVYCLALGPDETLWIGDESGAISHIMISPDRMAKRIQKGLKRDFTDDEWNYYIGNNLPRRLMRQLNQ